MSLYFFSGLFPVWGLYDSMSRSFQLSISYTHAYYGDSTQLVYLRARHYAPGTGRFLTKDTLAGYANLPPSLNRWNYVNSNPVNLTDPSGYSPIFCQSMPTKGLYEYCVLTYYGLEPINPFELGQRVQGERGCYTGPSAYRGPGYIEG
jgi:RHS repeat-associated protein